jgi:hypothetical protein
MNVLKYCIIFIHKSAPLSYSFSLQMFGWIYRLTCKILLFTLKHRFSNFSSNLNYAIACLYEIINLTIWA